MVLVMEDDMPLDELSKKAFKCLVDNFGYFNAVNYLEHIAEEARKPHQTYEEWSEEYFGKMTDEEFMADLQDYIKNHPHE